jgi:hypothetical protein
MFSDFVQPGRQFPRQTVTGRYVFHSPPSLFDIPEPLDDSIPMNARGISFNIRFSLIDLASEKKG